MRSSSFRWYWLGLLVLAIAVLYGRLQEETLSEELAIPEDNL